MSLFINYLDDHHLSKKRHSLILSNLFANNSLFLYTKNGLKSPDRNLTVVFRFSKRVIVIVFVIRRIAFNGAQMTNPIRQKTAESEQKVKKHNSVECVCIIVSHSHVFWNRVIVMEFDFHFDFDFNGRMSENVCL